MPYAVIDSDGNVRYLVDDVRQAVQAASQFSPYVQVENGPDPDAQLSGLGALSLERPRISLAASGLSQMPLPTEKDMSLEEAHKRLKRFFPTTKTVISRKVNGKRVFFDTPKQVAVKAYDTPREMIKNILGQNYKTAKVDEESDSAHEEKADVQGLSLLPSTSFREAAGGTARNACVGASPACIASCLVYSGHNMIDQYNVLVKAARSKALVHEPKAFVRILSEAVARHAKIKTAQPYVRLNVFSDLPWELICPELFDAYPKLGFYDYTKVENRETRPNYDLTFSFSGVNHAQVGHELSRGRRIAVVFIPPARVPSKGRARGEGLPKKLDSRMFGVDLGMVDVVDGDVSDVRPRDPGGVIVGLRWKVPMGRQAEAFAHAKETSFAVPVQEIGGVLVAATSARMEPITDADDQDDEDELDAVA
jgi:hypothetical protein